ncbi:MAG: S9 family peptidase [Chloroflexi bacterium]|nr:S9 family peptidase [Chloroflexota bacterium]
MGTAKLTIDQILAIKAHGGVEQPRWSPDGSQIVFISGLGGATELWSADPASGLLKQLTVGMGGVGHLAVFMPQWSPNGEYVAYVSAKTGVDEIWLYARDGSADRQLTCLGGRIEAFSWSPDSQSIALTSNCFGAFDIFRVNVADGATARLTNGTNYDVYPWFTPDGKILFVRLNDAWTDHDVILMNADGSNPCIVLTDRNFFDYHYGRTFNYPKVSPDGKTFLFRSHRSGWINVWAAPVEGGGAPCQIAPAEADQSDAMWSPDGSQIAYIENHNGTLDLRVVSVQGGAPRVLVAPSVGSCTVPSWSPDGKQLTYLFGTPTSPNDVWTVDAATGATRQLTHSMLGGGVKDRIVAPKKIAYKTFDGLMINAYLYTPPAPLNGQRYPGIMWIHGGPTSQYMDTFQANVQFFTQQGYVVLLPNIRGSSGYGRHFEDLNDRDWGHGDLQDVIAGVEYLKTLDMIDSNNIGITGTSYGGIMSMDAVAFTQNVFQAAIPCSGYGNFMHMADEQELRHIKLLEYEFGKLPEAEAIYRYCSPIFSVAQATTPCFLIHGEGRYPGSSSSRDFALALEMAYKPFWYKSYPGETYYVASPANVKQMLGDMKDFFDLYLKHIPYNRPDDGRRPLTHLSGVGNGARTVPVSNRVVNNGVITPSRDVAN